MAETVPTSAVADNSSSACAWRTPGRVGRPTGRDRSRPEDRARCRGGQAATLSPKQEAHLVALRRARQYTISELEELLFCGIRSTGYRALRPGPLPRGVLTL